MFFSCWGPKSILPLFRGSIYISINFPSNQKELPEKHCLPLSQAPTARNHYRTSQTPPKTWAEKPKPKLESYNMESCLPITICSEHMLIFWGCNWSSTLMRKGTRRPRNYASQCAGHWLVANSNQSRRSKRDHQASHGKTSMSINDLWNFDVLGVVKQGWKKGWFTSHRYCKYTFSYLQ